MSRGLTGASLASLALVLLAVAACGNTGLQPGIAENTVDTVSLYALDGTALELPSAFRIATRPHVVRTDQSSDFDFAFNITPGDSAVLLPTGALHLGIGSGIQKQNANVSFDAITTVPGGIYTDTLPVLVDSGSIAVVHSKAISCVTTASLSFLYAKLEVLKIDTIARRIDLMVLTNQNCGYRSLTPGNPTR